MNGHVGVISQDKKIILNVLVPPSLRFRYKKYIVTVVWFLRPLFLLILAGQWYSQRITGLVYTIICFTHYRKKGDLG